MRSRVLPIRRAGARSTTQRNFAQSTATRASLRARPQLPFLTVPITSRSGRVRFLTTERKAQLKYEILTGIKYTGYIWIAGACVIAIWGAVSIERGERKFPTSDEWSFITRFDYRGIYYSRYSPTQGKTVDWIQVAHWAEACVKRLHDPEIDGAGLKDAPSDCPPGTKDITAKSENWRRGYYNAMMQYAKASEHMEGWLLDKTRNRIFPPGTMIGPSNPYPKPLPPGFTGAPREEDCELRHENPDDIYLRILHTVGFTNRQKIEARIAYANWLEYKGISGPAAIIYEDALNMAAEELKDLPVHPLDKKTMTLNESAGLPSENLLNSLTAYGTFRARQGDLAQALPTLVSVLKARKSLPPPSDDLPSLSGNLRKKEAKDGWIRSIGSLVRSIFTPPAYPPPPPDGSSPPVRDPPELCQEAALSLHIGEIMYATNPSAREEGLGWTREAVDIAEEQLHKIHPTAREERPAREACRECLATGLGNWSKMVARLAKEEEARKAAAEEQLKNKPSGWFGGLWGEGENGRPEEGHTNRWVAEEMVIEERQRRVKDLVEDLKPPSRGPLSFFKA
ncbi:hypothetical protein QBC42DRAFT_277117 [Cladorrhinum samala]|uniref:MFS maltose permease n=1 Tax=Cladorrhinum samala TaxID=585594 RepID=A0AAV9HCZ9_9PEZI|nr:hypothetical protein QBC42DRAFT_277117 [Cladorrhinum samala]